MDFPLKQIVPITSFPFILVDRVPSFSPIQSSVERLGLDLLLNPSPL